MNNRCSRSVSPPRISTVILDGGPKAPVVLTGIGPELARSLVEMGVDLGAVVTKGSLEDGLEDARATQKRGGSRGAQG